MSGASRKALLPSLARGAAPVAPAAALEVLPRRRPAPGPDGDQARPGDPLEVLLEDRAVEGVGPAAGRGAALAGQRAAVLDGGQPEAVGGAGEGESRGG